MEDRDGRPERGDRCVRISRRPWWRRRVPVALTVLLGMAISAAAFRASARTERERVPSSGSRPTRPSSQRPSSVGSWFKTASCNHLSDYSPPRSRSSAMSSRRSSGRFRSFTPRLRRWSGCPACPRPSCPPSPRPPGVTASPTTSGSSNRPTTGRSSRRRLGPSTYPIFYLEPSQGNLQCFGLDRNADRRFHAAMARARDTGEPSATGLTRMKRMGGRGPVVVRFFAPVYLNGVPHATVAQRRRNLMGFVASIVPSRRLPDTGDRRRDLLPDAAPVLRLGSPSGR